MYYVIQKPINKLMRLNENQANHLILFKHAKKNTATLFVEQRIAREFPWFRPSDFIIAEEL